MPTLWGHEAVEQLKALAATGLSAAQCALHFDGMTRNSAVGIAFRHGFHFLGLGSGVTRKPTKSRPPRIGKPQNTPPVSAEPQREGMLTIYELLLDSCKYIHGDVQDPNHRYCGKKALSGFPYCANHCRICYQAPQERGYAQSVR